MSSMKMVDRLPVQNTFSGLLWGVVYLRITSVTVLAQDSVTKGSTIQDSTTKDNFAGDSSWTKLALALYWALPLNLVLI